MPLDTPSVADLVQAIKIIDIDTHYTEPHDLWTSRAPARLKDRVPRVKVVDGKPAWVIDDDINLWDYSSAFSCVRKDGWKSRSMEFLSWDINDVHPASYDGAARLKLMDESGIYAQILYQNVLGFGGQAAAKVDSELRIASIDIYNEAMAELQAESGHRLLPMAVLPWWDVKRSVKGVEQAKAMGMHGVNFNSDPHVHAGIPDLADRQWDPLWEACAGLDMPVNFHIGASETSMSWVGNSHWPSLAMEKQFVIGSSMCIFSNARVLSNIILSGILDRHPTIKFVSVESGIGWIPFMLEMLKYQIGQNAGAMKFELTPAEYFARNIWSSFWFETDNLANSIRQVGENNVMFETDFPHPTCLYPDPLKEAAPGLASLSLATRRKVLSENAAKLYNIDLNAKA